MERLLFGTAGSPRSSSKDSTVGGIERIAELGLGCMEVEFVRGVKMGEQAALQVAEAASRTNIQLSAHAPYYINLNARDPKKLKASQNRILQTARVALLCNIGSIVFHPAYYMGDTPETAYNAVKKNLGELLNQLNNENNNVQVRLETTGALSEFGTLDEILDLCTDFKVLAPCVDFSHMHARTGGLNSYSDFTLILDKLMKRLGRAALDDMHIHISGIHYGNKGELKHINLKESDLRYFELMKALKDYEIKGRVICESPNLEEDALLLQQVYNSLPERS